MMVDFANKYQWFAGGLGSYKNLIYRGSLILLLIHLGGMDPNKTSCHVTNARLVENRCGSNTVASRDFIAICNCLYPSYTPSAPSDPGFIAWYIYLHTPALERTQIETQPAFR